MKLRRWLVIAVVAFAAAPGIAHADPITAIAIAITTALPFVSAAVDTVVFWTVYAGLSVGIGAGINAIAHALSPNQAAKSQQRQASVMTLSVGETPREFVVGRAGTKGSLAGGFNWGAGGTEWETLLIIVADHPSDLEYYWINNNRYAFLSGGVQPNFNSQLMIDFLPAAAGQELPDYVLSNSNYRAQDKFTGQSVVVISYKSDPQDSKTPTWNGQRPNFAFEIKGARLYDPRKDSTVVGGSGAHRWTDPSTWEWSDNAYLAAYNFRRGIFAEGRVGEPGQLWVGRGLSDIEAPPERAIVYANLCDETVDAEKRYTVGGVIRADQTFIEVEGMFAAAMGGVVFQPEGSVEIEPGAAKDVAVPTITADVMLDGYPINFSPFGADAQRINTVVARYVEPSLMWTQIAADVQRDLADVAADGGQKVYTLPLDLVTSRSQANRLAEMYRRQARLERSMGFTLPPEYAGLEEADWVEVVHPIYTNGETITFRVQTYLLDEKWNNTLTLQETHSTVYGGEFLGTDPPTPPGGIDLDAIGLGHVVPTAVIISGGDGEATPAVKFTWDTPVNPAISAIRGEIRKPASLGGGPATTAITITSGVNDGAMITTNGCAANFAVEARLVPVAPGWEIAPSAWVELALGDSIASDVLAIGGRDVTIALAQIDAATAAAADLLARAESLAESIIAVALQGTALQGFVDYQTHIADDSLVSYVSLMAVMRADKSAVDLRTDQVVIDSITGETMATRLSFLAATDASNSGAITANSAAIASEITARASAVGAVASSLTTLTTTVGGHTSDITALTASINGEEARYTLTFNVDGHVTGWAQTSTSSSGSLVFLEDQLVIAKPGGDYQPFVFDATDGVAYLEQVYVKLLKADVVDTQHLIGGAVTNITYNDQAYGIPLTGTEAIVWSYGHTTDIAGAPHLISVNLICSNTGSDAGLTVKLYRDGTLIDTLPGFARALFPTAIPLPFYDEPAAGAHTYEVGVSTTIGSGTGCTLVRTPVSITEIKR